MVLVKVCGITNLEDALAAVDAGADALGFNFYHRSPRYVTAEAARAIIENLPADLLTVGVFVNEELPMVKRIVATTGVKGLQLHGHESPAYCVELKDYYLIKAFATGPEFIPEKVCSYEVQAIMVDAVDRSGIGGGTGRLSNWAAARTTAQLVPKLFLAGGLSATNVAEAIRSVKPYAVDACSLLESAPGRKDPERVRAFVAAVRAATI